MITTEPLIQLIKESIMPIPDYPKKGIIFRDITTLLNNYAAYKASVELITNHYQGRNITKVVGTEARGFIFGGPVALGLGVGFVPVRKKGKLPRAVLSESYTLEYGQDQIEIHIDAINQTDNVLIIDDLLATGGTIDATVKLIRRLGGTVEHAAFIIELPEFLAAQKLKKDGVTCYSLVQF